MAKGELGGVVEALLGAGADENQGETLRKLGPSFSLECFQGSIPSSPMPANNFRTYLVIAARNGHFEVVKALLGAGANTDQGACVRDAALIPRLRLF